MMHSLTLELYTSTYKSCLISLLTHESMHKCIDMSRNSLTGTIPTSMKQMQELTCKCFYSCSKEFMTTAALVLFKVIVR